MGVWIFMMIMDLLIPFTMIGFGKYFIKNAPKEINRVFGYRTPMSMKNKDTWEFAHNHCGKIWFNIGRIMLVISAMVMLFLIGRDKSVVANFGGILCGIQLVFLVGSIFPTERALKKNFDIHGDRKK
ncbi:SdpI family protein [Clostridium botulinum]|nr:SdpI family protein [Clostridium botulinum]